MRGVFLLTAALLARLACSTEPSASGDIPEGEDAVDALSDQLTGGFDSLNVFGAGEAEKALKRRAPGKHHKFAGVKHAHGERAVRATTATIVSDTQAVPTATSEAATKASTVKTASNTKATSVFKTSKASTASPVVTAVSSSTLTNSTSRAVTATTTATNSTSSPTCAPVYTAPIMITGTGTLPKPTSFVKRAPTGQGLELDGKPFRPVGANIYWLCADENVPGVGKGVPPKKDRVREILASVVAMGGNSVRIGSCSSSFGASTALLPALDQPAPLDSPQWDAHDYSIFAAREYGLRVILPLMDNYDYYHGGKYTFLRWRNVSEENYGRAFFTNEVVIGDFKKYIAMIMEHVNPYTGLKWGEDPTVLAWEDGNEYGAYIGREGYPPQSFTDEIFSLIKSLSPALRLDGSDGFYNYSSKETSPSLNSSLVDIMSDHMYPPNWPLIESEIPLAAKANKGFIIGEYDWTEKKGGTNLTEFLTKIENTSYMGDLLWSLFGHDSQCCNYITHDDGYALYYPDGPNTPAEKKNILKVVQHFYRMTGRKAPSVIPGVACPQPEF